MIQQKNGTPCMLRRWDFFTPSFVNGCNSGLRPRPISGRWRTRFPEKTVMPSVQQNAQVCTNQAADSVFFGFNEAGTPT